MANRTKPRRALMLSVGLLITGMMYGNSEPFIGREYITTEHFVIIYEPKDGETAAHVASFAEAVYDDVAGLYDSYPDKISCVINGRSDIYDNLFHPFPAHLIITVAAPTWPTFGSRADDWLRLVFTHELTHAIQIPYEEGLTAFFSHLFGAGLKSIPGGFLSAWATEGPAVLAETLYTSGGRGVSPQFEMLYKAMLYEGDFFSRHQAGSSTVFAPQQRPYLAGYLIASYIQDTYGDDALRRIQKEFVKFPFLGPEAAIRAVTGHSFQEIFERLELSLQNRYREDFAIPPGTRISPEGYGNYYMPVVTKRGLVLYRSTPDKRRGLVLFDPATGKEQVLASALLTDPSSFGASPEGDVVVYSAVSTRAGAAGLMDFSDLFLIDTGFGDVKRITEGERIWHPTISRDGSFIVAVRGVGSESCLVTVHPETGELRLLFRQTGATVYNPVMSDDEGQIVFAYNAGGFQDIVSIPFPIETIPFDPDEIPTKYNAAKAAFLTGPDLHGEFFPRFAGKDLLFSSDRSGNLMIYRLNLERGDAIPVVEDPVGTYAGTIIGDDVVYSTYTAQGYALLKKKYSVDLPARTSSAVVTRHGISQDETVTRARDEALFDTGSKYFDLPKLIFWAPLPVYYNPFAPNLLPGYLNSFVPYLPELGLGAFVYMDSNLGRNGIQALITYNWQTRQPGIDISGKIGIRELDFAYAAQQGYLQVEEQALFSQATRMTLAGRFPLQYETMYTRSSRVFIDASINYALQVDAPVSFSFLDTPPGSTLAQALLFTGGVSYSTVLYGARKDYFAPLRFSLWSDVGAGLFPLSGNPALFIIEGGSYFQFPSLFQHQVFGVGIDAVFTPQTSSGGFRATPRGGFSLPSTAQELSILLGLDYRFHIALLDLPLPYGYSVNHLAGGVYLETSMAWSSGMYVFDEYLYPGLELFAGVGSTSHISVGAGFGFRIDPKSISSFNIAEDFSLYLIMGTGGFRTGGLERNRFLDAPFRGSYP